jgi:hypothetical protein
VFTEQASALDSEFWSGVYHGRPISVLKRDGGWHVYLDHVLQHNTVFATEGYARKWLIKLINQQRVRGDRRALAPCCALPLLCLTTPRYVRRGWLMALRSVDAHRVGRIAVAACQFAPCVANSRPSFGITGHKGQRPVWSVHEGVVWQIAFAASLQACD